MAATVIIGAQWGDEGKGKFVDIFAEKSDIVARYNGSGGAAHTVQNKYGKFTLHLLPSGVFYPKTKLLMTNGVMIEPELLIKEISEVEAAGISLKGRLFISPRCHIVFPYHKMLDRSVGALFAKDSKTSPTTGRGNGPVHADKVTYQGIRLYEMMDPKQFAKRLKVAVMVKNKFIKALGGDPVDYNEILKTYTKYAKILRPYVKETFPILEKSIQKQNVLFEGVNGFFLDNDWGAYPHVTAASIIPSDVWRGSGINPFSVKHETVGLAKIYMTRVDNGECPIPTEWDDLKLTKEFRDSANEYGAGTGRPRRIAWFDTEVVKTSNRICHFDYLCLTRVDTLSGLKKVKLGVGYTYRGKKVDYFDGDAEFYRKVKPVYEVFDGWDGDIRGIKKYEELPKNARKYIERIEKVVGIPIRYVSTGPGREETIKRF